MPLPAQVSTTLAPAPHTQFLEEELYCLIIDDNAFDRERVKNLISKSTFRFTVLEAVTIAQARDLISQNSIDLILMDNLLPDGLGLFLTRELLQTDKFSDLPVIMLSGETSDDMMDAAFTAGCKGFLHKDNLEVDAFLTVLNEAIAPKSNATNRSLDELEIQGMISRETAKHAMEFNSVVLRLLRLSRKSQKQIDAEDYHGQAVTAAEIEATTNDLHNRLNAVIAASSKFRTQI